MGKTGKRWVFDASPLIVLGKINRLRLVERLASEYAIPEAVAEEIREGPPSDPARRWLPSQAKHVRASPVSPAVTAWGLGRGESAAISYAHAHLGFEVILDEQAARACAQVLGLKARGTLGILLLAKRAGHIERVRPHVEALLEARFRISDALLEAVLAQAGER